jgi:hypothetical protein
MARLQNSLPLSVRIALGKPRALELVERSSQLHAAYRSLWNNCHRFVSRIIDNGQALDGATFCRPGEHKIHRPDMIGSQRAFQWVTVSDWYLLSLSPPDLQTCFGIEPIYPLVIHHHASLPELQIDYPGSVAPMALGKSDDLLFQSGVAIRHGAITERTWTHANEAQ